MQRSHCRAGQCSTTGKPVPARANSGGDGRRCSRPWYASARTKDGRVLRAARLAGGRKNDALTRALRDDPHLGPFLSIPSKDNGFDIEGLAAAPGGRLFLGCGDPCSTDGRACWRSRSLRTRTGITSWCFGKSRGKPPLPLRRVRCIASISSTLRGAGSPRSLLRGSRPADSHRAADARKGNVTQVRRWKDAIANRRRAHAAREAAADVAGIAVPGEERSCRSHGDRKAGRPAALVVGDLRLCGQGSARAARGDARDAPRTFAAALPAARHTVNAHRETVRASDSEAEGSRSYLHRPTGYEVAVRLSGQDAPRTVIGSGLAVRYARHEPRSFTRLQGLAATDGEPR